MPVPKPPGASDDPVAQFPAAIYDGLSENRPLIDTLAAPEANDWNQLVNEVIAIETMLRPSYDDTCIWVAPWGVAASATGKLVNPYKTLAAAFAAISATKKTILLLPGTYTLTAIQALPVTQDGIKIIGIGEVIIAGGNVNQALSLTPGAQGAAFTITLENIKITQYTAKKGLYIDDTAIDGTVTVNLKNCEFTMTSSGSSIDLLHAVDQTVTINCTDCTFTGPVTLDCINASDAFNFTRCNLAGGVVTDAGAVTAALVAEDCEIKHEGFTGGNAAQTLKLTNCWTLNGPADVNDAAGSHTATISFSPILTSAAQGDILYRGASAFNNLAAGTSGYFLKTQGAAANPIWADPYLITAGAATPAVALRFGKTVNEGFEIKVYDEIINMTNAASVATNLTLPAPSIILSAQVNLETDIVGDGSGDDALAKIGLGVAGTTNKYGVAAALTQNTKIDTLPDWSSGAGGETLGLYALAADGSTDATEKFVADVPEGTRAQIRVRVVYATCNSLDNAS